MWKHHKGPKGQWLAKQTLDDRTLISRKSVFFPYCPANANRWATRLDGGIYSAENNANLLITYQTWYSKSHELVNNMLFAVIWELKSLTELKLKSAPKSYSKSDYIFFFLESRTLNDLFRQPDRQIFSKYGMVLEAAIRSTNSKVKRSVNIK